MFEEGKQYTFRCITDGAEGTFVGTVKAYDHPLIKLADTPPSDFGGIGLPGRKGEILNVTSPNFVSAVLKEETTRTAAA